MFLVFNIVVEISNASTMSLEEEIVEIDAEPEGADVSGGTNGGGDQHAPEAEVCFHFKFLQ